MKRNKNLYRHLAFEIYRNAKICIKCYSLRDICVHHKDENAENNTETNLQILCRSCHIRHHHIWKKLTKETKKLIWVANRWNKYWLWNKSHLWKKHSKEHKIKIGISQSVKVNQYDLDWNFIKEWISMSEVRKSWIKWNISLVCSWKRKQAWWYKWSYYKAS